MSAQPQYSDSDTSDYDDTAEGISFEAKVMEKKAVDATRALKRKKADKHSDSDSDDEEEKTNIELEFQIFDPRPNDCYSVRKLIDNFLDTSPVAGPGVWNGQEFSELIANQVSVGGMIKSDAEEQVLGFLTALNLHAHADKQCIKQLKSWLLKKTAKDPEMKATLQSLFDDTSAPLGLLVNNRMINTPVQLVPPLLNSFMSDVKWAVANEETEEERNNFKFANYIIISRLYESKTAAPSNVPHEIEMPTPFGMGGGKKSKKKKRKTNAASSSSSSSSSVTSTLFYNFEEEHMEKFSPQTCSFPVPPDRIPVSLMQDKTVQHRRVLVLKADDLPKVAEALLLLDFDIPEDTNTNTVA